MKRNLLRTVTAMLLIFAATTSTKAEVVGDTLPTGIIWTLDTETGVLQLDGVGHTGAFELSSTDAWLNYRDNIRKLIIGDSILTIGDYAFSHCRNLEEVITPNTEFGYIKDQVGWHIGNQAFFACTKLKSFTFPKGITFIGDYTFEDCTALESVYINGNLSSSSRSGGISFRFCTNLKKIYIADLKEYVAAKSTEIGPCELFTYADSIFVEGKQTTDIVIPEGIKNIAGGIFWGCEAIKSVKIPTSATQIGIGAFGFSGIESVTIPTTTGSLTIFGGAFHGCKSLKEVHIENINAWNNIDLHSDFVVGAGDVNGSPLTANDNVRLIVNGSEIAGDITVGGTVNKYAFYNCDKITSVTFESKSASGYTHRNIEQYAFANCDSLRHINFASASEAEKSYYYIEENAFANCPSLEKVELLTSASLTLGTNAFANCGNIDLYIDAVTVGEKAAKISNKAFTGCTGKAYINTNNESDLTRILYGTEFSEIVLGDSVTKIPYKLFQKSTSLHSITLPETIESIAMYAFDSCTSLRQIGVPENITIEDNAFANCTNLDEVYVMGAGELASVGANIIENTAMYNNAPNGGIYIGRWLVAYKRDDYHTVHISDNTKGIASRVFANDTLLATIDINEVKYINERAFEGCTNLGNVQSDFKVEYIGNYAFNKCKQFNNIEIMFNAKEIGNSAFMGCENLSAIHCDGLEKLGDNAFRGCISAQVVECLGNITEIPSSAFNGCTALTNVTLPDSVTIISNSAFEGCSILTNITIPNYLTSIGNRAFRNCTNLTSIDLPNSVTSIGESVFYKCTALSNVTIGNGVTTIGKSAFESCTGLTSIKLPSSVDSIGNYAFYKCDSLTSIYVASPTPAKLGSGRIKLVSDYNSTTLYVPRGSLTTYQTTNIWKNFVNIVEYGLKVGDVFEVNNINYRVTSDSLQTVEVTYKSSDTSKNGVEYADGYSGTIVIPESVTNEGLTYSVTSIGESAFSGCTALTGVEIPASVTMVDMSAFIGCSALASVNMTGTTPPILNNGSFADSQYASVIVRVPDGALAAYQSADNWKEFKNIVEYDVTGIDNVVENEVAVKISAAGLSLEGCEGKPVAIYKANGSLVKNIDTYDGSEIVLDKCVYIVRVSNKVVKVKL